MTASSSRLAYAARSGAARQVDLVHHAENEREADPQQRIGGAEQHAVGNRLHRVDQIEQVHVNRRRCSINRPTGGPADRLQSGEAASGRRLVQDQPASVLGVDVEERLDRLAIGRASDLAEQAHCSLSAARPRILLRSACTVSGRAMIFCCSITSLRMNMIS